jgi:hypothetical protein
VDCDHCQDSGYLPLLVRGMMGWSTWLIARVPAAEIPWCTECEQGQAVHDEYANRLRQIEQEATRQRIAKQWGTAKIPLRFRDLSLDIPKAYINKKTRVIAACKMYMERGYVVPGQLDEYWPGTAPRPDEKLVHVDRKYNSLVLSGPVGVGKTAALSVVFSQQLADKGLAGLWIEWFQFILEVQKGYNPEVGDSAQKIEAAQRAELLLLDDVGSENLRNGKETDDRNRLLWLILEYRHREQLPTLMTTNLDERGLRSQWWNRTIDRMMEMAFLIPMNGENLRNVRDWTQQ